MLIVHVDVVVHADAIESFRAATLVNAKASLGEPGIARFDVLQHKDNPARFTLVEIYRTDDDAARHKDTEHYKTWRATVESMMAQPRSATRWANVFPGESDFETPASAAQ